MENHIGFFQFDNLIRGRVPFILVNLGVDLTSWYKSVEGMHLTNVTLAAAPNASGDEIIAQIKGKNLPIHFPVVVIDQNGTQAKELVLKMEAAGFTNAYLVEGGFEGIAKERAHDHH